MASTLKVDTIQTNDGTGTIALQNQLSGMTTASLPALGSAQMPTGSVLQVVSDTYSTETTTTPTSFTNTGLSATITPTSTSSKILVMGVTSLWCSTANYLRGGFNRSISGGSDTFLGDATDGLAMTINAASEGNSITLNYLDSPSTTSITTYYYQYKCTHSAVAQKSGHMASMILMEIAG